MPVKFDMAMLRVILLAGWRRRYLVLAPFAVLPLLSLFVGLTAQRVYESRMSILVQEIDNNPVVQDLAVQYNIKDRMEGLGVLLQSRHILDSVIDNLHLLPADASDADRDTMVGNLSRALSAKLIGKDLIELKMRSKDTHLMPEILKAASDQFIVAIRAPGQSSVTSSETFLRDKITERKALLDKAEIALANFRNTHSDQLPELHASNVARLDQLKQTLQDKKTELAGAEASNQVLRARLAQANPIIGKLEEQIVQVSGELAVLRARYTDEHSAVQGAMRQLERLQEERAKQIEASQSLSGEDLNQMWNRAASMPGQDGNNAGNSGGGTSPQPLLVAQLTQLQQAEAKISGLKREIDSLTQDVADLESRTDAYGEVDRQMTTLDREVHTQRELYDSLTKRFETARLTVDLGEHEEKEQIKVIDLPGTPSPVNLPLIMVFLAGCFGAAGLGIGMAFVAELLDGSIRSVAALEKLVGVPVLSSIPLLIDDSFNAEGMLNLPHGEAA